MAHLVSILSRFLGKEELAFKAVYDEYHQKLYNYAMAFVRDHQTAEEIRNDALVKIYQHGPFGDTKLGPFGDPKHLRNFAYEVTKNSCLNHQRYIARKQEYYDKYQKTLPESEELLVTKMENAERMNLLYNIIQEELSEEVKKVMILFYLKDLTAMEIAGQENKSVDTVRKQLRIGRDTLKKFINLDELQ